MNVRTEIDTSGVFTVYRVFIDTSMVWSYAGGNEPEPGALELFHKLDSGQRAYTCPTCGQLVFQTEDEHKPQCARPT